MKLFVIITICVVAAAASVIPPNLTDLDIGELQSIIDAIYHPSTDPATAAALEQLLHDLLGITQPEAVVPEENEIQPIEVLPEIIDESIISEPGINQPEAVVPEENEIQPIEVLPEIIEESIISEPANYPGAPLVQVIIKVNSNAPENAVVVEQPSPKPIVPEEVSVVEQPEEPEPVLVAPIIIPEKPVEVPEPVIVAPIQPIPVVNIPEILN